MTRPDRFRSPPMRPQSPASPPPDPAPLGQDRKHAAMAPDRKQSRWGRIMLGLAGLFSIITGGRGGAALAQSAPGGAEVVSVTQQAPAESGFSLNVTLEGASIQCRGITAEERQACLDIARAAITAGDIEAVEDRTEEDEDGTLALWLDFGKVMGPALVGVVGTITVAVISKRKSGEGKGKPAPASAPVIVVNTIGAHTGTVSAEGLDALAVLPDDLRKALDTAA